MSDRIRTIVAGVSHPAPDDPTLIAAAQLARWTGAALHLVHAFDVPATFAPPHLVPVPPEWTREYEEGRRGALQAAARQVPGAEAAACHTGLGSPAPAILETAEKTGADLVVVGAARHGRLAAAFLGTTAQRVLRGAQAPVLVLRRGLHRPLERVLLAADLSEPSGPVHEMGLDAVHALFGAPDSLRLLHVVSLPALPLPGSRDDLHRAARAELERFAAGRRPREGTLEPVVRVGAPVEEIVAQAEDWDPGLLVVGTHARGWTARLALGSVAEAALRDVPCNVLAVPLRALAPADRARRETPAEEPAEAAAVAVPA